MTTNGTANGAVRKSRFALGGPGVRLELSDGDWVLIRPELSYGQQRRLTTIGLTGVPAALAGEATGQGLSMDWSRFEIERLATWLLDWSFRDADGDQVVVSREAIENLPPDTAGEINAVLDAYLEAQEAKKASSSPGAAPGPSKRAATSPSASASAGAGRS